MLQKDFGGRVHFLHEDEEVLYTVEADTLLDTFYSIGELQDAISSLSLRDPMAQLTALSLITNSPYIFEDSPLSSQILDKFTNIYLQSEVSSVVHGACDALVACVRSISPSTCIQYLQVLFEAICRRIEAEEDRGHVFNEDVCTIILTLVSACESLLSHVCSNVHSIISGTSGLYELGNLGASFFYKILVTYNYHLPEIQRYLSKSSSVIIANTPFESTQTTGPCLQYLILLDSIIEYANLWMRRLNALPYASEGMLDYFMKDTVAESIAMTVHPGTNHICADTVAELLAHPCIISRINSAAFNRHLLELSPTAITSHVLVSRYLANVFLRMIYHDGLFKLPKFYTVTLACCGIIGQLSLHICENLHPLDLVSLLCHVIDESQQEDRNNTAFSRAAPPALPTLSAVSNSPRMHMQRTGTGYSVPNSNTATKHASTKLKDSSLPKLDSRPAFTTSTKIDYTSLEISSRTTLPPLKTQLKIANQHQKPRSIFIASQNKRVPVISTAENSYFSKGQTESELKRAGTRRSCTKVLNLMKSLTESNAGQNTPPEKETQRDSQQTLTKTKSVQYIAIEIFLTTFSQYQTFSLSVAQATIANILTRYSDLRRAPPTLCRVLGSPAFAQLLEKRTASILLQKAADIAISALGRGALSASDSMLRAAITFKFAGVQPRAQTTLKLPMQSSDILRQFLAAQVARNVIQRSGVLCMTLLDEFAENGVDSALFLTNSFYQSYQFNPAGAIVPSPDGQVLDFPVELVRWLHIDGAAFETWINKQQNRHVILAKMLSTVASEKV